MEIWISTIVAVLIVSMASLIGITLWTLKRNTFNKVIFVLVSFAVGSMLGNVLFDLIPEAYEGIGNFYTIGWLVIAGFLGFLVIENLHIHRECDEKMRQGGHERIGYMNLIADGIHNFVDGILIAVAWLTSDEVGVATTIAVLLHELPQELSDYGILIKAGFTKQRAIVLNLISALTAVLGAILALVLGTRIQEMTAYLLPVAAGGFIYLSIFSLLPLIIRGNTPKKMIIQMVLIACGVALVYFAAE